MRCLLRFTTALQTFRKSRNATSTELEHLGCRVPFAALLIGFATEVPPSGPPIMLRAQGLIADLLRRRERPYGGAVQAVQPNAAGLRRTASGAILPCAECGLAWL